MAGISEALLGQLHLIMRFPREKLRVKIHSHALVITQELAHVGIAWGKEKRDMELHDGFH